MIWVDYVESVSVRDVAHLTIFRRAKLCFLTVWIGQGKDGASR